MENTELIEQLDTYIKNKKANLQVILKNFFDIKYMKINIDKIIIDFQVVLAELMYDISSRYNDLCRVSEENDIVKNYKYELQMLIRQAKAIGDGYAWIFYHKNIEALRAHLKHEDNGLFPIRNGGLGEIEFIKNNKVYEGCYVLYHSITSILRNGDFSLITANGELAGIGEIKTKQVENELIIDAYTTQKMIPSEKVEKIELHDERIGGHLKKQLCLHNDVLNRQKIGIIQEEELRYVYELIEKSVKAENAVVSEDCSMIVYVVDKERKDAETIYDTDIILNNVEEMLPKILNNEFERNEVIQSELTIDSSMWEVPLLWWDFPEAILTKILLRKWLVLTWFNKDFLLDELRKRGFNIQRTKSNTSVYKQVGNKIFGIDDLSLFLKMATVNFVEVKSVILAIENVINKSQMEYEMSNLKEC